MTVSFWTPGAIPLTSFTLIGAHAKVVDNPIGQFGTGLKYAVSVILRHGGTIRMFIEGIEYEFLTSRTKHRDKELDTIRLRRRHGTLARWISVKDLPFTLNYGRNWTLWQAYRELESNTRDENGVTYHDDLGDKRKDGTTIEVDCPGFREAVLTSEVFLDTAGRKLLFSSPVVNIYDGASNHLYYRGIRVHELRYPARLTYDFKYPYVQLTEDRTAGNSWSLMYQLTTILQRDVQDRGLLNRILSKAKEEDATFETMDLNFEPGNETSDLFRSVASSLTGAGIGGRSASRFVLLAKDPPVAKTEVSLPDDMWNDLMPTLQIIVDGGSLTEAEHERLAEIFKALQAQF